MTGLFYVGYPKCAQSCAFKTLIERTFPIVRAHIHAHEGDVVRMNVRRDEVCAYKKRKSCAFFCGKVEIVRWIKASCVRTKMRTYKGLARLCRAM